MAGFHAFADGDDLPGRSGSRSIRRGPNGREGRAASLLESEELRSRIRVRHYDSGSKRAPSAPNGSAELLAARIDALVSTIPWFHTGCSYAPTSCPRGSHHGWAQALVAHGGQRRIATDDGCSLRHYPVTLVTPTRPVCGAKINPMTDDRRSHRQPSDHGRSRSWHAQADSGNEGLR